MEINKEYNSFEQIISILLRVMELLILYIASSEVCDSFIWPSSKFARPIHLFIENNTAEESMPFFIF